MMTSSEHRGPRHERTRVLLAILLLLTLLAGAGCAKGQDDDTGEPAPDESPELEQIAPPGIYSLPDGTFQALGILAYRDVEGGFWAVVKTALPEEAATAEIVAVVLPDEGLEADLQTMNGEYVSVVGVRRDGPSVYAAGPVIEAQSVEVVRETEVQ